MWKAVLILFLLTVAMAGSPPKCSVCQKVSKCSKDLWSDTFIDPIYNYLIKQVKLKTVPLEIRKELTSTEARYFFFWS